MPRNMQRPPVARRGPRDHQLRTAEAKQPQDSQPLPPVTVLAPQRPPLPDLEGLEDEAATMLADERPDLEPDDGDDYYLALDDAIAFLLEEVGP